MCNICNPMTDALRGQILNAHNARRGSKLNWDCGLETNVDNYVKRCPGRSDPNQAGENFYRTSSGGLQCYEDWIDKAVNHWTSAGKIVCCSSAIATYTQADHTKTRICVFLRRPGLRRHDWDVLFVSAALIL
ncbi:SCP-like protein [Oesophagostomum dentatum]|uniref:SCP-like protein n=1 Tax=Oesophagostomum dentatum TaxID=61180 RepID=A0A0B1TED5_OESDE|nr:SCP-like protein [Oesophagostomum dentatum]